MAIKWEYMEHAHLIGAQIMCSTLNILTHIFLNSLIQYGITGGFAASLTLSLS